MSKIEWTEKTWNPTTGCDKISQGCKFCYAEVMSKRLKAMGQPKYQNGKDGFQLTLHHHELQKPYLWKKPQMIFVNSMSDLFHKDVSLNFIQLVFNTMRENPQHTFQVLTKRSKRLLELNSEIDWPDNLWMGVSVEDFHNQGRIWDLMDTDACVKFLSCEPLIGPLWLTGFGRYIDWVIVGGESGRNPRPIDIRWVRGIRDFCISENVPFFFKQWGGTNKKKAGRLLDGKEWNQMPHLRNT